MTCPRTSRRLNAALDLSGGSTDTDGEPSESGVADTPIRRRAQPHSATTVAQPAVGRAKMIIILGVLVALGPVTMDLYLPALPAISTDFSASSSVVQLTLTGTLAGLALGQLIVGPLSDSLGRRAPLIGGIVLHIAASVGCMAAPSIAMLGAARVFQGVGAASAMVVAVAVVGDLFTGSVAATVLSRLMLILGAAPILAPSLGAAVLLYTSWRATFVMLIGIAAALLIVAIFALPETLPASHRRPLRLRSIAATYRLLLTDPRFVVLVLVAAMAMSGLFAYVAASPFVLQGGYGLNQQAFAIVFGVGAVALIGATQFNVILLQRFSPQAITVAALIAAVVGAGVFVALAVTGWGGLAGFVAPAWFVLATMGLVMPNSPALALSDHAEASGTAAAILGTAQFGVGAAISPVVGLLGNNATALAAVMTIGTVIALTALLAVLAYTRRAVHRGAGTVALPARYSVEQT